jgi:hypothetical protein
MGSTTTNLVAQAPVCAAETTTAVTARRFVTIFDSAGKIAQGDASTSTSRVAANSCDSGGVATFIPPGQYAEVDFAGTVVDGGFVKADADGKAVAATAGNRFLGIAVLGRATAVANERGQVFLTSGTVNT